MKPNIATMITLRSAPGQAEALADLLTSAAALVKSSEPKTIDWYALRLSSNEFAIFDTFEDESGRSAHFEGQVASALKDHAEQLVEGGWEEGVLKHIHHFDILSGLSRA